MTRPGDRLRSLASSMFRPEEMERIIDPTLADLQSEFADAMTQNRAWRARGVLLRGYLGLASVALRLGVRYMCDPRATNPGAELARAGLASLVAFALLTVALALTPALPFWPGDFAFGAYLSALAIPQALPLSIPAALCLGVLWATYGTPTTWRGLSTVALLAAASTFVAWVAMEWMIPEANQQFRQAAAMHLGVLEPGTSLPRGLSELGLSGLSVRTDAAGARQYHLWLAVCVAAFPLGLLAYGVAGHVRRRVSAIAWALGLSGAYLESMWLLAELKSKGRLPAHLDAWTPTAACLLIAALLLMRPLAKRSAPLPTANLR